MKFEIGYTVARNLRVAADATGYVYDRERSAIDRLEAFEGTLEDIEALAPLALVAGLPWLEMFPELAMGGFTHVGGEWSPAQHVRSAP